ncbi:MAG: hypothetical protein R3E48_21615 [Burkholderiaceae bacterium]
MFEPSSSPDGRARGVVVGNVIFGLGAGSRADSDPETGTISMAGVRVGDIDAGNPMPKGGVGSCSTANGARW